MRGTVACASSWMMKTARTRATSIIPAQFATPDDINFMARFGRGLICLALTAERVEQLDLNLCRRKNGTRHETAFTVSIEAREGVTTGISAADRAHTITRGDRPGQRRRRHRQPRPCVPAGGPFGRRAGTRRAYRSGSRYRTAGGLDAGRRYLRNHE